MQWVEVGEVVGVVVWHEGICQISCVGVSACSLLFIINFT